MANFDTLKATIAARIPDNIDQLITAEDVRQSFLDTIDEINAAKADDGGGGGASAWGQITGNIDNQTDLKNALDGKADKVAGAISGHLAGLDANGDLTDSGSKASDFATAAQGAKADTAVQPGDLATVASTGDYDDLLNKPTIPPGVVVDQTYDATSTDAQSGVAMAGALAGKQDTISNLATIEAGAAAGATAVQPGSLAAVATSGSYADLLNKPTIPAAPGTLNTDNSTAQTTSSSEALSGTVKLHKVSKTGSYNDLLDKPTIPAAQVQADWNEADNTKADYIKNKPTIPAAQVNSDWDAVSGVAQILNKPTIPSAPGTLDTTATTAQATNASEALSGAIKLHKISKTGSYGDLLNKPTIDAVPTADSTNLVESGGVYSFVGDPIVSLTVPTPNDGTVIFTHRSGDTTTLDLNHVHLAYPKYQLCADEAEYAAIAVKESDKLYCIPEQ